MTTDNMVPIADLIESGKANLRDRRAWMALGVSGTYPIGELLPAEQADALEQLKASLS